MDDLASWDKGFFKPDVVAPEYSGLSLGNAKSLATTFDAESVRVVDLDASQPQNITFDYRSKRLTVLVRDGLVVRAGWF